MMEHDNMCLDPTPPSGSCMRDHCSGVAMARKLETIKPQDGYTIGLTPEEYRRKYGCSPRHELLRWQCDSCSSTWFSYLFQHDGRLETVRQNTGRTADSTLISQCHRSNSHSGSISGHTSNRPSISTSIMSANSSPNPSPVQHQDMPFGQSKFFTSDFGHSSDTCVGQEGEHAVASMEAVSDMGLLNWQFGEKTSMGAKEGVMPVVGSDMYFDNLNVHDHVNTPLTMPSHAEPHLRELSMSLTQHEQQLSMGQDASASFTSQPQTFGLPPHKRGDNFDPVAYQYSREHGVCDFHRRQKRKCNCNISRRTKRQADESEQE